MDVSSSTHWKDLLKQERLRRNWRQQDVADHLGTTVVTIKRWERGSQQPSAYFRVKLCVLFGKSAQELGFFPEISDGLTTGVTRAVSPPEEPLRDVATERGVPSRREIQATTVQQRNRIYLLERLRLNYETLLKNSFQGAARIALGLAREAAAVSNAATLLLRVRNQEELVFPQGTPIAQVYEGAQQELLILGVPGTGKSTLLTELALHLVMQAEADESHPLPIIVPLSTWAVKRQSLEIWLSEQVSQIYHISASFSEQWVKTHTFLPLLDGLDEMDEAARPACIAAINAYHRESLGPLVVCSRTREYHTAAAVGKQPLMLQDAVVVQPLTNEQVDASLTQGGKSLEELRQALKENRALQELATMPLMLNLLQLTYQGAAIQSFPLQVNELQQQVLQDYVKRMVAQKGDDKRYPLERTCLWLSQLARQMRQHNQTVFYLEHLQPTWLPTEHFRSLYETFAGKGISLFIGFLMSFSLNAISLGGKSLANDVLFGLTGGLLGGFMYSGKKERFRIAAIPQALKQRWKSLVSTGVKGGLCAGIPIGLVFTLWPPKGSHGGLIAGASMFVCFFLLALIIQSGKHPEEGSPSERSEWALLKFSPALRREHIELGLITGLSLGISLGVSTGASMGVSSGWDSILIGTFLSLLLLGKESTIELKETMTISVHNLVRRRHLLNTLAVFLLVFLLNGLSAVFQQSLKDGLIYGLSTALSLSLSYWVFIGLWTGVSQETLQDRDRVQLNQGIRYSFRNALLIGLLASGISLCVGAFGDILDYELRSVLKVGFSAGLPIGFVGGLNAISRDVIFFELFGALLPFLLTGGLTWLRHYLLRWFLSRAHITPLHYKHFLNDATQRILFYQVGGGYRFIHTLLLEYFVEIDVKKYQKSDWAKIEKERNE